MGPSIRSLVLGRWGGVSAACRDYKKGVSRFSQWSEDRWRWSTGRRVCTQRETSIFKHSSNPFEFKSNYFEHYTRRITTLSNAGTSRKQRNWILDRSSFLYAQTSLMTVLGASIHESWPNPPKRTTAKNTNVNMELCLNNCTSQFKVAQVHVGILFFLFWYNGL